MYTFMFQYCQNTKSPPNFIFQMKKKISIKPLRKEKDHHNQIWIQKSIMQREDISTPHIYYTQQESFWLFFTRMCVII